MCESRQQTTKQIYRWLRWFLLMVLTLVLVSACDVYFSSNSLPKSEQAPSQQLASSSACQIVKHELGETKICGQPQRVVALDPHVLDLMLSLGVEPVGYAEVDYYSTANIVGQPIEQVWVLGEHLTTRPISVGTREQPSLEALLRLKPDLILQEHLNSSLYPKLTQIAPTLFIKGRNDSNAQWQQSLLMLGRIFAREQLAQQTLEEYKQTIAQAKAQLESITHDSKLLLLGMSGIDNIDVETDKSFIGALLKELGFIFVIPEQLQATADSLSFSLELLPQLDADIIIVIAWGDNTREALKQLWQQNPILRSLPANQAKRVYFLDGQLGRIRGPIAAQVTLNQIREFFLTSLVKKSSTGEIALLME